MLPFVSLSVCPFIILSFKTSPKALHAVQVSHTSWKSLGCVMYFPCYSPVTKPPQMNRPTSSSTFRCYWKSVSLLNFQWLQWSVFYFLIFCFKLFLSLWLVPLGPSSSFVGFFVCYLPVLDHHLPERERVAEGTPGSLWSLSLSHPWPWNRLSTQKSPQKHPPCSPSERNAKKILQHHISNLKNSRNCDELQGDSKAELHHCNHLSKFLTPKHPRAKHKQKSRQVNCAPLILHPGDIRQPDPETSIPTILLNTEQKHNGEMLELIS